MHGERRRILKRLDLVLRDLLGERGQANDAAAQELVKSSYSGGRPDSY